mgnify:FL=1
MPTSHWDRYRQLALLIIAAGVVYPIPYMRQNFENSMLEAFSITQDQLGECSSLVGLLLVLTYVPSGWLADRFGANKLLSLSMASTGAIALWMATSPTFFQLKLAFAGLGITSGLLLWGTLIKTTSLIAPHDQQGRFFGMLESGRGIAEAVLATAALALFAYYLEDQLAGAGTAIAAVLQFYGWTAIVASPLVLWGLKPDDSASDDTSSSQVKNTLWHDVAVLLRNQSVWLSAIIILVGYQIFWVTYSFASLLEDVFALGAVTVGGITVARLWMRPIGPLIAGFIGDRFHAVRFLSWLLLAAAVTLVTLPLLPAEAGTLLLLPVVLAVSLITYGIRGIYWATLDDCKVAPNVRGVAIGLISLLAYTPDMYVPQVQSFCLSLFEGREGYLLYYGIFASTGIVGFFAARRLAWLSEH